jgi:hypothetical protein
MSNSTFNVNNIKYFSSGTNNVILIGDISITTSTPHSIVLSATINESVHLVVDKFQLDEFRRLALSAPITKHNVYLYDQQCNIVSKYESNRKTNVSGNVSITNEPEVLLGNITLPKVIDGSVYFCLFNYSGLQMVSSAEHKKELIKKDMVEFLKINDVSKVNLFIKEDIANDLIDNLSGFNTITIIKSNYVSFVSECIFGKIISSYRPSFQGFINFPDFEIVQSKIKCDNAFDTFNFMNRRNGRIQVNTFGLNTKACFMILLERKNVSYIPSFYEEVTGTKFDLDHSMWINPSETSKTLSGLNDEYLYNYVDAINFLTIIKNANESTYKTLFQETYFMIVLKYLFHPIENVIKPELLQNNSSKIIYDDFIQIMSEIRRIIKSQFAENQSIYSSKLQTTAYISPLISISPSVSLSRNITSSQDNE